MNLEQISAALTDQLPERDADLERRAARLEVFGNIAFVGLGIILLVGIVGILYAIITKMILSGAQPLAGVLLANFVLFAALALTYVFLRENLNERKKKARAISVSTPEPDAGITNKLLQDPIIEPAPSIVEETTDLLPTHPRTRNRE